MPIRHFPFPRTPRAPPEREKREPEKMLKKVRLTTENDTFVAVVEIPPFMDDKMPGVILWGDRVFAFGSRTRPLFTYREVFAWVSLTTPPGLEDER